MDENNKRLEALKKIEVILNDFRHLFLELKKDEIKISEKRLIDPLHALKRVNGIIKNYNEKTAEVKLNSLIKFLSPISKLKK